MINVYSYSCLLFQDEQELTALHIACRHGRTDMVLQIIKAAMRQKVIYNGANYIEYKPNLGDILNKEEPEVSKNCL